MPLKQQKSLCMTPWFAILQMRPYKTSRWLGRFWWHLVHCFLNTFASKRCKRFPSKLNDDSTLPCETWNAYRTRATLELLQVYPTSTATTKFARFESSWLQCCEDYCKRRCTKHVSLTCMNWKSDWEQSGTIRPKAGLCRHCGSHSSMASLIAPEQWCVFCAPSLATVPTWNQLVSNLSNMEATVEVG